MELTPREKDKLLLFTAALLAERRLAPRIEAELPRGDRSDQRFCHGRRA